MKRTICLAMLMLIATAPAWCTTRVQELAHAIARTEGFGRVGTIPTRYHNPGDIRAHRGTHFPGQVGLNKRGYVIFKNDAAGWAALYHQIEKVIAGESIHYTVNMTLKQFSRKYATSPLWVKNVSRFLQVTPSTTLAEILDVPPVLLVQPNPHALDSILGGNNEAKFDGSMLFGIDLCSGFCAS
jgi:hypothetical protein